MFVLCSVSIVWLFLFLEGAVFVQCEGAWRNPPVGRSMPLWPQPGAEFSAGGVELRAEGL